MIDQKKKKKKKKKKRKKRKENLHNSGFRRPGKPQNQIRRMQEERKYLDLARVLKGSMKHEDDVIVIGAFETNSKGLVKE